MSKKFDREDEPNEFMEMPCRCNCGKWFDLLDGYASERRPNVTICGDCQESEEKEIERENVIQQLKEDIDDAIVTIEESQNYLNNAKIKLSEYGIIYPPLPLSIE